MVWNQQQAGAGEWPIIRVVDNWSRMVKYESKDQGSPVQGSNPNITCAINEVTMHLSIQRPIQPTNPIDPPQPSKARVVERVGLELLGVSRALGVSRLWLQKMLKPNMMVSSTLLVRKVASFMATLTKYPLVRWPHPDDLSVILVGWERWSSLGIPSQKGTLELSARRQGKISCCWAVLFWNFWLMCWLSSVELLVLLMFPWTHRNNSHLQILYLGTKPLSQWNHTLLCVEREPLHNSPTTDRNANDDWSYIGIFYRETKHCVERFHEALLQIDKIDLMQIFIMCSMWLFPSTRKLMHGSRFISQKLSYIINSHEE